ncbi:2-oxo acid dehydrogenase subunit E2 [Geodermatophilus chilensis]|uniref:2-oxo acid dehydrogenase subunit E2 n=1 Tax=Geodermatophilus chilensis TaxID=2035835 RepID=UPI0018E4B1BB|nr:2-oxo acid dehydrogenase subunit E2 [Geodermatophilus chilensis]
MPGVSADATEAALLDWAVEPGATVKRGDVIASVETDKAVVELEAEEDAVLFKTLASAGEMVPIGGPIAVFVQPGEEVQDEQAILGNVGLGPQISGPLEGADEERSQDALVPGAKEALIEHTADAVVSGNGDGHGRVFASPLARRLATQADLRLEDLEGTGPGGRIRRRDVEAALSKRGAAATAPPLEVVGTPASGDGAAEQTPAPAGAPAAAVAGAAYTEIPHSRFRRAVAAALTASKQQVPHFYLTAACRVDALLDLRRRVNDEGGVKITINDFFVKAAARAMVAVPDMNVVWTPDAVRRFESVDIAVAVASERGLVTPVVRSAQSRSLSDISATVKDLAARAAAGTLKQQELEGGSLAISNLGMYGVEEFAAIINPPQVGILAVGAVTSRPIQLDDGGVGFGQFITVVLSADHRPVDGALAAQWLARFRELVENPIRLLV